jgi:predicted GIY-YIG superfamily endonuclease
MTRPYTYRIFCKITEQFYYGVRFAKNCDPSDLFVKYFTSSKGVKKLIKIHGMDNFVIEIRKIFNNKEDAIRWERRVNHWTMKWPNYLNKHSNGNFILTNEERKEIGIRSGNKCRDLKLGFHSMSLEEKILAGNKANETNRKNGTGIYSISKQDAILTGEKCRDLKLGFHSAESRAKQRESATKPWWNNGSIVLKSCNSPGEEWQRGRLTKGRKWWNNGNVEIMSILPPDNTWNKGRLK